MTLALITNDDGIASPGLCALAQSALDAGLDVVIAAPAEEASGSSAAITGTNTIAVTGRQHRDEENRSGIRLQRRDLDQLPGIPAYSVRAAPGLIALLGAHKAFGDVPDLVLSGINHGANVGHAILHSGTVGAALTGGVNGARGLAVSLDVGLDPVTLEWATGARVVREVLPLLLDQPTGTVLNLNVPNVPLDVATELREARLAPFGIVHATMTEPNEGDVRITVRELPELPEEDSDASLLLAGYATVTNIVAVREAGGPPLISPPTPPGPRRRRDAKPRRSPRRGRREG